MKLVYKDVLNEKDYEEETEVKSIKEIVDTVIENTFVFFLPEDNDLARDLLDEREYDAFADAASWSYAYKEPISGYIRSYAEILKGLSTITNEEEAPVLLEKLNSLLCNMGYYTEMELK